MESKLKIGIIIGSTRPERFGEKPAKWIFEEANKRDGIEAELLDLRDYRMPFLEESAAPMMLNGNYSNLEAKKWSDKIKEFDGFIIVTPEYNHGAPAVLKNALDYGYSEWAKKPVAFISYGYTGGARAVFSLQPVVINLNMVPLSSPFAISNFWERSDEQGNFKSDGLQDKADDLLTRLEWWSKLLKEARAQG